MTNEEIKAFAVRIYHLTGKIQNKLNCLMRMASAIDDEWTDYDDSALDLIQIMTFLDKLYISMDQGESPSRADIIKVNSYEVMFL